MPFNSEKHRRRSIRLPGYDYSQPGAYFVTICTLNRACLFGDIVNGVMRLNPMGCMVQECWMAIPQHFPHVVLDAFVVMPNHVHGILVIVEKTNAGTPHPAEAMHSVEATHSVGAMRSVGATHDVGATHSAGAMRSVGTPHPAEAMRSVGATHASPLQNDNTPTRPRGPKRQSIASIVGSFKSAVTKCINEYRGTPGAPVWQRNYYEHIIRTEESLNRIREYILQNPLRWHLDRENPERTGVDELWNTIFPAGDP